MLVVWTARVWLVVANTTGLAFISCAIVLHRTFLTSTALQIGLSQLGANTSYFFQPVLVGCSVILTVHVLLLVHSFTPIYRLTSNVLARVRRSRGPRITPTSIRVVSVVPSSVRTASGRFASNKGIAMSAWTRYGAEITRLFILWEVALQTFQAYKLSYLVTSVSINRLLVLVVVTNCWFSPLLYYAMGSRPKEHFRLGRLVIDSCLDVVYSIGIPLAILYPYYRDFDGSLSLYPVVFYYDDTWYVNAVSELRQVFVTSWPDFVSKGSGGLSLVYRLWKIKAAMDTVLRDHSQRRNGLTPHITEATSWYRSRLTRVLDLVLMLWGATVLAFHVTSSVTSMRFYDPDCLLEMRPWGSLSYSCASFEISCSKRGTRGDKERMETILTRVDPLAVQNLILSNCEELHMPQAIQNLRYLSMLKIYNSTIASWDAQSALQQKYHPQLQVIYLARVNMSALPDGFLATDFPSTVWDLEMCITNLSTFPSAVTTAWGTVGIIALEGNPHLTELPEVLATLPNAFAFNVGMNNIHTVRDDLFENHPLVGIGMNGNPVTNLPDMLGSIDHLQFLDFVDTQITEIPAAWMKLAPSKSIQGQYTTLKAAGTPLCRSIAAQQEVQKPEWLRINCDMPVAGLYSYPIREEDTWRRANQQ